MNVSRALELIDSIKDNRVLFVGDTIIDEYNYVVPLGKSPKENLVPVKYLTKEVFPGGVQAAANHARSFVAAVGVVTGGWVVRKVRMVDQTYLRKLFEIQYYEEQLPPIEKKIGVWHTQVVADFGHGAVDHITTEYFGRERPFFAVTVQTNAANVGFNLITKCPYADYIVIDEPEARLAAADRTSPIEAIIEKLAKDRCHKFIVTQGTNGATGFDGQHFYHEPALTQTVVDTMGAGDAFFAVTALMAHCGSIQDLLLIGNAAGALKCGIVGHRASVTKTVLMDYLRGLK